MGVEAAVHSISHSALYFERPFDPGIFLSQFGFLDLSRRIPGNVSEEDLLRPFILWQLLAILDDLSFREDLPRHDIDDDGDHLPQAFIRVANGCDIL